MTITGQGLADLLCSQPLMPTLSSSLVSVKQRFPRLLCPDSSSSTLTLRPGPTGLEVRACKENSRPVSGLLLAPSILGRESTWKPPGGNSSRKILTFFIDLLFVSMNTCHVMCVGQRTACRYQCSPSTMGVSGIELGSSSLEAAVLTHSTI